jgi:hypothetical protein
MDYDNPQFIAAVRKILRSEQSDPSTDPQRDASINKELPNLRVDISDSSINQIKAKTKPERKHEWWKDFFEVLGIAVLALYTIFAYFQWDSLNTANLNQSAANISSGATADRSLLETHTLAVSAEVQAKAAREEVETTQQYVISAEQNFIREERAWIGFAMTNNTFSVFNFGKEVGHDVVDQILIHPATSSIEDVRAWVKENGLGPSKPQYVGELFPNQPVFPNVSDPTAVPNLLTSNEVKYGTVTVYMIGRVTYSTFGKHHLTEFCGVWKPTLAAWNMGVDGCKTFTHAD